MQSPLNALICQLEAAPPVRPAHFAGPEHIYGKTMPAPTKIFRLLLHIARIRCRIHAMDYAKSVSPRWRQDIHTNAIYYVINVVQLCQ